jgi:hypothetical protein
MYAGINISSSLKDLTHPEAIQLWQIAFQVKPLKIKVCVLDLLHTFSLNTFLNTCLKECDLRWSSKEIEVICNSD